MASPALGPPVSLGPRRLSCILCCRRRQSHCTLSPTHESAATGLKSHGRKSGRLGRATATSAGARVLLHRCARPAPGLPARHVAVECCVCAGTASPHRTAPHCTARRGPRRRGRGRICSTVAVALPYAGARAAAWRGPFCALAPVDPFRTQSVRLAVSGGLIVLPKVDSRSSVRIVRPQGCDWPPFCCWFYENRPSAVFLFPSPVILRSLNAAPSPFCLLSFLPQTRCIRLTGQRPSELGPARRGHIARLLRVGRAHSPPLRAWQAKSSGSRT